MHKIGRAYSMNRLDQLAQPVRRYGEHIRAILERERREQMELLDETESVGSGRRSIQRHRRIGSASNGANSSNMSRSMTHLTGAGSSGVSSSLTTHTRGKYSLGGGISSNFRPLGSNSSSMTQLTSTNFTAAWSSASSATSNYYNGSNIYNNYNHKNNNNYNTRTPTKTIKLKTATTNNMPHILLATASTSQLNNSKLGLSTAATKKYLQSNTNTLTDTTIIPTTTTDLSTTLANSTTISTTSNITLTTTTSTTNTQHHGHQSANAVATPTITATATATTKTSNNNINKSYKYKQQQHHHQQYRFDPNSLLLMNSSSLLLTAGVCVRFI